MLEITGIQRATGEFLFFIDSDDYLDQCYQRTFKNCAEETAAEIVCYGFSAVNRNEKLFLCVYRRCKSGASPK